MANLKAKTFRVTDHFINKLEDIKTFEKNNDFPMTIAQLFDEMIDFYYQIKILHHYDDEIAPLLKIYVEDILQRYDDMHMKLQNSLLETLLDSKGDNNEYQN